jgi:hypothetical protein
MRRLMKQMFTKVERSVFRELTSHLPRGKATERDREKFRAAAALVRQGETFVSTEERNGAGEHTSDALDAVDE